MPKELHSCRMIIPADFNPYYENANYPIEETGSDMSELISVIRWAAKRIEDKLDEVGSKQQYVPQTYNSPRQVEVRPTRSDTVFDF